MTDQVPDPTRQVDVEGADGETQQGPVVRDRRRLDPETGQVRQHPDDAGAGAPDAAAGGTAGDGTQAGQAGQAEQGAQAELVEELRGDLQRLQAEYVNYRRRVDRDRDVARDAGVADVLEALFPVLDDLYFAREHGELTDGPFAAIADKLHAALARFGLEQYGSVGEPFDPAVHEALMHSHSAEVTETTVVQVLQPGYRQGARVLRPARVGVADPE
ncbi:nucleotide exchange factor GrpE [Kineosporiaceae bacterium SCSIO 59966]|nr:nucleotide exchange factor GrpE [Kineosporiaceae bacterium SCSIO 59966]